MSADFESYSYFPTLRSRIAELTGFEHLRDDEKNKLVPLITLGKWPKSDDITLSLARTQSAVGDRPYMVDLTREPHHQTSDMAQLLNPEAGFQKWRDFVSKDKNIIPVIQFGIGQTTLRDIIRQITELERSKENVVFRITNFERDIPRVVSGLAVLGKPENALVVVDLGYIRNNFPASQVAAVRAINDIRAEVPEAIITVVSSSYPPFVGPFISAGSSGAVVDGQIDIMERTLFQALGGDSVITYGDYGSIHALVYPAGGRFTPRIDVAFDDRWCFQRKSAKGVDSEGYIECAKAILKQFPDLENGPEWGKKKIHEAARGQIDGMKTPLSWIGVRVNLHLSRQLALSELLRAREDEEDGDDAE